ncbi:ATP-dependent helicase HrpB [Rhodobacteraceae bacterium XHP0102]|nr:ATP-dependent helicase HrpB [Rhodobacteraceae bacterium XHP0102]
MHLPIDDILPELIAALARAGRAVLQAPPGAGKTTRVPLALLEAGAVKGRILMLEPRRLAARAAAERMAQTLGEGVGQTIGYRMRGDSKTGPATRIEVVTEGILTRMIQEAPDLPEIGAIIFDEFHERSLNADLGLALSWELRGTLRPDLQILVMSATLDAAPVAALLDDAPLITSAGQAFEVVTHHRAAPLPKDTRLERAMADLIARALRESDGGILAFLPGQGEIARTAALLDLPPNVRLHQLYGAIPLEAQRAAITPEADGARKVVLATSIAETSLTISDISVVIDSGRARRARFDPASGMTRLVTEPVSRAEADQRRGRAGRVAAGICYRNWTKGSEGALPAFPPAEIEAADLTGLALELALWGSADGLAFLTPPPAGALAEARALLQGLGGLDAEGRITAHGRAMAAMPLHPRLAHMLLSGDARAARIAALLGERDPLQGQTSQSDLTLRLRLLDGKAGHTPTIARIRQEVARLAPLAKGRALSDAQYLALAYPDRIGLRRAGDAPRYILSGGKGAAFDAGDELAATRLIVASDLDGNSREARIRGALPISEAELRDIYGAQITWQKICDWNPRLRRVEAKLQERFGALSLDARNDPNPDPDKIAAALCAGIRDLGLNALGWTRGATFLRARIAFAGLADVSDAALLARLEDWALPYLGTARSADDLGRFDPSEGLKLLVGYEALPELDRLAPAHWTTPLGRQVAIDYSDAQPAIALRIQEVFGVTEHPRIGPDRLPIKFTLLSPAQRPIQVTQDLPQFWEGSYADVRKDMRAQYPRHPWPEDPRAADPTLRAKPRGT